MEETVITSRQNPMIRQTAALKNKKFRDEAGMFLAEGIKLLEEAVASGASVDTVFTTESNLSFCRKIAGDCRIVLLTEEVFEKISTEKAPQGVICRIKYIDKLHFFNRIYNMPPDEPMHGRIFMAHSVRDPGNLGTVIRTARAFGVDRVILSADCADLYNSRTVRAAMGALFRQRIEYATSFTDAVSFLRSAGYVVYAAMPDPGAIRLSALSVTPDTVFVIGNEGHGLPREIADACTGRVYIPMAPGSVESLNAAAAATIFLWTSFRSDNSF